MKTVFIAKSGSVLDISKQKISVQENNSKVSDQSLTKIMFPFDAIADDNFIHEFGDVVSDEVVDIDTDIEGYLEFEGKLSVSKLDLISTEGNNVTGQIEYGLEEVPNFDKKLSELPLESFSVPDIHIYAKEICEKKYPETNFSFPRIFTPKYSPEDKVWDAFNGYYNDLNDEGTEMRRNYIDGDGEIYNQNIIHPCPHILYILKTGFADKGYGLKGDILTDPVLAQRWVFSGTEYFSSLTQQRLGMLISSYDYDSIDQTVTIKRARYNQSLEIPNGDVYHLLGKFSIGKSFGKNGFIKIFLNENLIFQYYSSVIGIQDYPLDLSINISANSVIRVEIETFFADAIVFNPVQFDLIGKVLQPQVEGEGEDLGVITNLNLIDLKRAVPEITFGDLVNTLKNWFNYDLEVEDNFIIMNKIINGVVTEGKNFEFSEILRPKKTFLSGKSFLLKFSDLDDNVKLNSMFFDKDGPKLNGSEKKETNIIEVNGYAMPVLKAKDIAPLTAKVMKDSTDTLALVWYDGLILGQNNAKNPEGCNHPELFANNWESWLKQRIRGMQYEWFFKGSIEKLSQFSIKDYIFCYNNLHIIKSWTKDKVGEDSYEVQITTETVI